MAIDGLLERAGHSYSLPSLNSPAVYPFGIDRHEVDGQTRRRQCDSGLVKSANLLATSEPREPAYSDYPL